MLSFDSVFDSVPVSSQVIEWSSIKSSLLLVLASRWLFILITASFYDWLTTSTFVA